MQPRFRSLALVLAIAAVSTGRAAPVSGQVVDRNGDPVPHTSVIVRETLDAARTDNDGRFTLDLPESGPVVLAVVPPNQPQTDQTVELHPGQPLVIHLQVLAAPQVNMDAMTIDGGSYSAVSTPKSGSLSPIEVVLTPGAAADLNRAIQSLPGVQNVDEGNALFVRGGDYWETAPFINGSVFPTAVRLEAPTGTFVGTVGPFLTKKITFLSGGFGVRYGNLLSGVVDLETQDRPADFGATLNLGLGAISAGVNTPLGKQVGIRVTATHFDLKPSMQLNGSSFNLNPPPRGSDVSGSVVWDYRRGGQFKLFAIQQTGEIGVQIAQPSFDGFYHQNRTSQFAMLSWKDGFGGLNLESNVSAGNSRTTEHFGGLDVTTKLPSYRWSTQATYSLPSDVGLTAGAEGERTMLRMRGYKPNAFDALAPGAADVDVRARVNGNRTGIFAEANWVARRDLTVIAGVRTDDSTLTHDRTFDPRASASYEISKGVHLTTSVGEYHQVPDILFYNPSLGGGALPSMRATQAIAGVQFGDGDRQLKVEAYRKDYRELTQFTRSRTVSQGGVGRAQGLDVFAKAPLPAGLQGRVTVSLAEVERTDPDSGKVSATPFGIRNSTTIIVQRAFPGGYQAGFSWRYASGKPVTDITGATYDSTRNVYSPIYGSPYAARFPESQRLDFSFTKISWYGAHYATVFYLAVNNVLGRKNVYDYVYSADYRERHYQASILNRSVYFGVTVMYR